MHSGSPFGRSDEGCGHAARLRCWPGGSERLRGRVDAFDDQSESHEERAAAAALGLGLLGERVEQGEDPLSMREALDGVTAVFLLPGYADMPKLVAEIERVGAARIVQLSGGSAASGDMSNAITRYMAGSEAAIRASGLTWTIVRPTAFMANALRWLPQLQAGNVVRVPFAGVHTAAVDPFDIAAAAAAALTEPGRDGRVYYPTGPESMLPEEQVGILADVLGRRARFGQWATTHASVFDNRDR
jgi:uncharacterized protein YbjT (DUF2867 family)